MRRYPAVLSVLLIVPATAALSGCSAPNQGSGAAQAPAAADFTSRRVPGSVEEIRPVAERVFRSHFRADAERSTATRLISRPTEVEGRGEAHSVRDRMRLSPGRVRQYAELRLQPAGAAVMVQVSVRSERLETAERASFARQRGDDRPNATAIDRSGPASVDTREEWVSAGRDGKTEREVLDEIQASLATQTQPSP